MIIYKATNKKNGKVYIGQTTQTLKRRKNRHLNDSERNCGFYFHRALKKYGSSNFEWEIIDSTNSIEELNKLEVLYIKTFYPNVYNMDSGGLGSTGYKHTQEFIDSISGENAIMKRPGVANKRRGENHPIHKNSKMLEQCIKNLRNHREKAIENRARTWIIINPKGKKFKIRNMAKFCRIHSLNKSAMTLVSQGKRGHHKKWRCLQLT